VDHYFSGGYDVWRKVANEMYCVDTSHGHLALDLWPVYVWNASFDLSLPERTLDLHQYGDVAAHSVWCGAHELRHDAISRRVRRWATTPTDVVLDQPVTSDLLVHPQRFWLVECPVTTRRRRHLAPKPKLLDHEFLLVAVWVAAPDAQSVYDRRKVRRRDAGPS